MECVERSQGKAVGAGLMRVGQAQFKAVGADLPSAFNM